MGGPAEMAAVADVEFRWAKGPSGTRQAIGSWTSRGISSYKRVGLPGASLTGSPLQSPHSSKNSQLAACRAAADR